MSNAPRRMELRSTRLAIRAENKNREAKALEEHKSVVEERNMHTAKTFEGQFNSRYAAFHAITNPGCEYCGENHYD